MILDEHALRATMRGELASALNLAPEELQLDRSFLAQGGDSLLAIQFMARCHAEGVQVDITDILQHDTLSQLLAEVAARTSVSSLPCLPLTIESQRSDTELALFAQLKAVAPALGWSCRQHRALLDDAEPNPHQSGHPSSRVSLQLHRHCSHTASRPFVRQ